MHYLYKVEFETDPETKEVIVSLPSLNYTADSGDTVEAALANLRELATGFIEVLTELGQQIPPSDPVEGGIYLALGLKQEEEMAVVADKSNA